MIRLRVLIDPRVKFVYASYYYYGFQLFLGAEQVAFDAEPFVSLKMGPKDFGFDHFAAMVIEPTGVRLVIDYGDKPQVNKSALEWSDVYAKINIRDSETDRNLLPSDVSKIVQIGPGFGINQWGFARLSVLAVSNRFQIRDLEREINVSEKQFFGGYNWARKREPFSAYSDKTTQLSRGNYVFHVSQYYINQAGGEGANNMRLSFVKAASIVPNVSFEGGLVVPPAAQHRRDLRKFQANSISSAAYLKKTKESAVVFNTPAAWSCHGWKLGEYFALGKAIISMPFVNNLLPGLVHGENIHLAGSEDELADEISQILSDREYQLHLERGARAYFSERLHPKEVARELLERAIN